VDYDEVHVRNNLGIAIFNTHPSDSGMVVTRVSVKMDPNQKVVYDSADNPGGAVSPPSAGTWVFQWLAEITYGPWDPLRHSNDGDPASQPIRVYFEGQTFQEDVDFTVSGNPVCNSASDPYDPTIKRDRTRPILRVIRNEASFTASTILGYADKVNSDVVGPYAERTLKCSCPIGEPKFSQFTGDTYYEVTYIIHFNPDTWDPEVPDVGLWQLDPSDATKRLPILSEEGLPVTTPQYLDGSGHALAPPVDHTDISTITFEIYEAINFASSFAFPSGTFV
jgi:hypothetical protein